MSSSVVKNSPSPYLSVKSSTVSLSPIMEEPVGYTTTSDIYDYDVNLSQPLQGEDPGEFCVNYRGQYITFHEVS